MRAGSLRPALHIGRVFRPAGEGRRKPAFSRVETSPRCGRYVGEIMDIRKVEDLLAKIELTSRQIEGQNGSLADYTGQIRSFVDAIRKEVVPPPDDNRARTRDEITPREWAEYEWHDVTAMGDRQRKYIRGLKR
jgi:hypothetical protein